MTRWIWTRTALVASALAVTTACGAAADKIAEEGIERAIESDSGEDVEVDFDGQAFEIETDEGSIRMDADGNFVVEGPDGEVFTGQTDDDGNVRIESEDGSATIEAEADGGNFTMTGEDGESFFGTHTGVPDQWPGDVPRPAGFDQGLATISINGETTLISIVDENIDDPFGFVTSYAETLEGAGFERTSSFEGDGRMTLTFEDDIWNVSMFASEQDDSTGAIDQVSVSAMSK